jgi:hypothetical protein
MRPVAFKPPSHFWPPKPAQQKYHLLLSLHLLGSLMTFSFNYILTHLTHQTLLTHLTNFVMLKDPDIKLSHNPHPYTVYTVSIVDIVVIVET